MSTDSNTKTITNLLDAYLAAALEAKGTQAPPPASEQIGGRQCHLRGLRHEITGQFYALSQEDRAAMNKHCDGIVSDLDPQGYRERWLATAIAQDQWRLDRARAIENNIFATGMSGALTDATNADSPEVLAAVCQARVWLTDSKQFQALSIYEQRIRRTIEKNEKQLKELQAPRKAERAQALEEAILLAEFATNKGETCDPAEDLGENPFGFSAPEILRLANRRIRLQQALEYKNRTAPPSKRPGPTPIDRSKVA